MKSLLCPLGFFVLALTVAGCGPLQMPMPERPDAEQQKAIDDAWDKAVRPVDRYAHQTLLDILVATRAYQVGVDKLTFRSEKRVEGRTVVMEIRYDRLDPAGDRFEVQVLDRTGKLLRREPYDRKEVEDTYRALFVDHEQLRRNKENGKLTPEQARQLAEQEARWKVINEAFPNFDAKKGEKAEPGQKRG